MVDSVAIVVTGVSGAIGPTVLAALRETVGHLAIIYPTFRSDKSREAFEKSHGKLHSEERPWRLDITDSSSCRDFFEDLAGSKHCLIVNMAADVSWTKSGSVIKKTNVNGALRVAEAALAVFDDVKYVFFSTAFASDGFDVIRNDYEKSKLDAVASLRSRLGDARIYVISPSGILGNSQTGFINRFNATYPLMWLAARNFIPVLEPLAASYTIDNVPVDWVASETALLVKAAISGERIASRDLVLTLGQDRRVDTLRFCRAVVDSVNLRLSARLDAPIPYPRLAQAGEVMPPVHAAFAGYYDQLRHTNVRAPQGCQTSAPDLLEYLPTVTSYWLDKVGDSIARAHEREQAR